MSSNGYMPPKQAEQVDWSQNFATAVSVDPQVWNLPASMTTDFVALNASLQSTWTAATEPSTRTKVTVQQLRDKLRSMKVMARKMVSTIQGAPGVSDEMLVQAGLTVRKTTRTPEGAPAQKPIVVVTLVDGRRVDVELRQDMEKRGKAPNASIAVIFTHIGETAPSGPDGWTFAMQTTKTKFTLPFPAGTAGQKAYITAFWSNSKGQSSPGATPVSVDLPAGGVLPQSVSRMKIAA